MNPRPARRRAALVASSLVLAVVAAGATSCSTDAPVKGDAQTSAEAADAKQVEKTLNAGLEAHAEGDLGTAKAKYSDVLKSDADNKFAFYNLALIDEANGNYGLAEENYRRALEADPAYEPALFNLAILRTEKDPREAIKLYKAAVAADKKDAAAWMNLGLLLRQAGKQAEGDKAVSRAIALNPTLEDPEATSD